MPDLMVENYLAWEVFAFTNSEVSTIGGMSSVILGIKFEAIDRGMDHLGVVAEDRWSVFDKVVRLGRDFGNSLQEDSTRKMSPENRPKETPKEPPPMYRSYEEAVRAREDLVGDDDEED